MNISRENPWNHEDPKSKFIRLFEEEQQAISKQQMQRIWEELQKIHS